MMENQPSKRQKAIKHIKNLGEYAEFLGWFKIIMVAIALLAMINNMNVVRKIMRELNRGLLDMGITVVWGVALIVLGRRIQRDIGIHTKKYVWILAIPAGVIGHISAVMSAGKTILTLILFYYAVYVLFKFKHLHQSMETPL